MKIEYELAMRVKKRNSKYYQTGSGTWKLECVNCGSRNNKKATKCYRCGHTLVDEYYSPGEEIRIAAVELAEELRKLKEREEYYKKYPWKRKGEIDKDIDSRGCLIGGISFILSIYISLRMPGDEDLLWRLGKIIYFGFIYAIIGDVLYYCIISKILYRFIISEKIYKSGWLFWVSCFLCVFCAYLIEACLRKLVILFI